MALHNAENFLRIFTHAPQCGDKGSVLKNTFLKFGQHSDGIFSGINDSLQEKLNPGFPISVLTNTVQ